MGVAGWGRVEEEERERAGEEAVGMGEEGEEGWVVGG